jgi:hypothetical protein
MESHLHPLLEHPRLTCPDQGSNPSLNDGRRAILQRANRTIFTVYYSKALQHTITRNFAAHPKASFGYQARCRRLSRREAGEASLEDAKDMAMAEAVVMAVAEVAAMAAAMAVAEAAMMAVTEVAALAMARAVAMAVAEAAAMALAGAAAMEVAVGEMVTH